MRIKYQILLISLFSVMVFNTQAGESKAVKDRKPAARPDTVVVSSTNLVTVYRFTDQVDQEGRQLICYFAESKNVKFMDSPPAVNCYYPAQLNR